MAGRRGEIDPRRAALRASGAALLGAIIWTLVGGPMGATVGVTVVAAFAGWLIGSSARSGSTPRRRSLAGRAPADGSTAMPAVTPRAPDPVRWIAVAAAVGAWLVALAGIYVYSLAAIPTLSGGAGGGTDLADRLRETPILSFYAQSFGILDAIEGAVLIVAAWWSSR